MLGLLAGDAVCPCCVYSFSSVTRRSATQRTSFSFAGAEISSQKSAAADLRIDGALIVDTLDGTLIEDASILVAGGRIIGIEQDASGAADPGVRTIDASGKYVVPGYNDMHSHVLELDNPSGALALMLAEGVTGFRQMSGSPERLRQRRAGVRPAGDEAPDVLQMPGPVLTPLIAGSAGDAIAEIRRQKAQGADFIKVGFVSPPVFIAALEEARRQGMPILGHLQDGMDAATTSKAGFRSVEHLGPGATVWIACSAAEEQLTSEIKAFSVKVPPAWIPFLRRLIEKRIQMILINPAAFLSPTYVARMQRAIDTYSEDKLKALAARFAAEETWHVPTLVRLRTQELADAPEYESHPYLQYMPKDRIARWRKVTDKFRKLPAAMRETYKIAYPRQLQLAKALSDQGVRMMAGTDGGWLSAPGLTLQEEFAELARAGFSPLHILQMTTINPAEYLGRADTMGTVQPGRNADLVLLDANPLHDVANLGAIYAVVRAGKYYSRQDLAALQARVAAKRGYLN